MMSHPIIVNDEIDWKTFEKECKKQGINFQYQRYLEEGDKKIILQKIICCIREHLPNEFVVDASPTRQHRSKLDKLVAETELARGFLAIREIIQPKLIVRLPIALVLQVQAEMNRQSSSYLSAPWATSTSSSSSLSSSSFPSLSSAPSSSQSSSHLAVGFVGATGSTSQAKKLAMKRKIKRDEDPPFRAPYVKKEDYENGPREDEKLELDPNPKKNCGTTPHCLIKPSDRNILWVMCELCNQWFHCFCVTLKNRTTDWNGKPFLCCGNMRDRRTDCAKRGKVFRRYASLKKRSWGNHPTPQNTYVQSS